MRTRLNSGKRFMRNRSVGDSITEYAIPLVLLGTVAFFLTDLYPNMRTAFSASLGSGPGTPAQRQIVTREFTMDPNRQTVMVTLSNGNTLSIPNYPMNLAQSIETLGPNGTTDILADSLMAVARQLKDSIPEDEFNQLKALSEQGHRMAALQGLLEQAAINADGSKEAYNQSTLAFEAGPAETVAGRVGGSNGSNGSFCSEH